MGSRCNVIQIQKPELSIYTNDDDEMDPLSKLVNIDVSGSINIPAGVAGTQRVSAESISTPAELSNSEVLIGSSANLGESTLYYGQEILADPVMGEALIENINLLYGSQTMTTGDGSSNLQNCVYGSASFSMEHGH